MSLKKTAVFALTIALVFPSAAQASYFSEMGRDLVRGVKNVAGAPLEIPITIQEYHESSGYPVVRHLTGLTDGIFQAIARLGSGFWDILPASVIPGIQDGFPVKPETLF